MTLPADEREHVLCDEADGRINELEAEVERLRQALQRILDHGKTHDEPCYALHNGDCADVFQEIARAALSEERA